MMEAARIRWELNTKNQLWYGTYDLKKILLEKKRYSRLTSYFFWRVQITTKKKLRPEKRYSHLADGGGSDLGGTKYKQQ
jgi:hypothetical protein